MSKYLNVFNTLAEYQAFSASTEYVQPNVALVKETNVLYYDYGDNKPQVDMSSYKGEFQDISVGGDYYGKNAITKINYIPSGITDLSSAFNGWSSLKEVTCEIPSGVKDMSSTFKYCSSLVNGPSVIPNSVTNMNSTFSFCSNLVNGPSVIPIGITSLYETFNYCLRLVNTPVIPSSVTSMNNTFWKCKSIKELTLLPITPPTNTSGTLMDCVSLESIYVPDESVDTYKTATGWSEFASKIKPLSEKPTE